MIRLGDIATVTAGQAAPKDFSISGTPFIRAGHLEDLVSGKGLLQIPKVNEEIAKKNRLKKLPKGSILFAKSGMSAKKNRIYISENDTYFVSHLAAILPSNNYDTNFLARYLNWYNPTNLILDDAYPSIRLEDINNLEIPLPDLLTQQKIATILDKADELRQYHKQLIEKYDALTQSLFLDMFGDIKSNSKKWNLKPFEYFVKFDTRMTSDFVKYANYPHIGIANIEKETGRLVNYKLISEENLSSGKYIFDESHIIYSKIRPNLNKVALPNFSGLCSADSYPLKVIKENSNRIFFAYVLRSDSFVDFILTHSTRTNIPKANKEQIKKYTSIAPPLDLQNQFAERIQLIETQKQQAQEALVKSEALFQGLLQQAFKGELT
ncbi:restriction endonuclease subunit S [Flavobacterium sp. GSP6]|uniref:restriction endonuclease subunit S n=1 Tax=Flavobacterium sp. GSP6 TaxID=2497488 RepID=UPI000F886070|nr:restriction endonuclease subunit S [Flavobacterium sp. GSP6]RTZ02340.1 restriction endonuclease subunit S [Flavobacterium sp. GSP6]